MWNVAKIASEARKKWREMKWLEKEAQMKENQWRNSENENLESWWPVCGCVKRGNGEWRLEWPQAGYVKKMVANVNV